MKPQRTKLVVLAFAAAACGTDDGAPLETAKPGVVFTFPIDGQLDVPTGARVVVAFSDPVVAGAVGGCDAGGGGGGVCLVGPAGVVEADVVVTGARVELTARFEPGTPYALHVGRGAAPFAENLPASGPLLTFTTRASRPHSSVPRVVAINGDDPAKLAAGTARPIVESTTLRLVFSEPIDPKTVIGGAGSVELVGAGGAAAPVPVTVIASGIHVSIDPRMDLAPGAYELRLGTRITDLGGRAIAPVAFPLTVRATAGAGGPIRNVLQTRQPGDPGPAEPRTGARSNVIELVKPLIGRETVALGPAMLAAELGDPAALGGPIAFTIRRGQRLRASGLDVKLGGEIPVGLQTGELQIELLTDAGGRLYRNPYQAADQRPENARAPLYVDLAMDIAVWGADPNGDAVLSQTILGVQATGIATPTDGVLAIETVASMDLGLLGVTTAPTNLVLELFARDGVSAPGIEPRPPALVATFPADGSRELPVDGGIELIFDEPVDLDRLRDGGIRLEDANGGQVAVAFESHGASVVVRPLARLAPGTDYRVLMSDVADLDGNRLAATSTLRVSTLRLAGTGVPATIAAISPGAPCALTGANAASPGRCSGGLGADDLYRPFTLPTDQPIEVELTHPVTRASAVLGAACGTGSVRVEALSAAGACTAPVPGTLLVRERGLTFVPDTPWTEGARYRLTLVSGGNDSCDGGELCGTNNSPPSFDPLAGMSDSDGGGPNLVVDFTGAARGTGTPLFAAAAPWTDTNGSGTIDTGESLRDENRAALRITGTSGAVSDAEFTSPDCLPATTAREACMYLTGAMPVSIGELTHDCPLPGGATAPSCLPVAIAPETMYATSVSMDATVGIAIGADTGTTVMRIREPVGGAGVTGYIIDGGGQPKLVVALDLYMDAPDMSLPLSDHDLHSKKLSLSLEGPVRILPDGRIAIALSNIADVPVTVAISAPLGISGEVMMIVPKDEMKLQLVSRPIRGVSR